MNIIILNNRACLGLVSDLVRILNPVFGMLIQNRIDLLQVFDASWF
jgi:hypothetical protein